MRWSSLPHRKHTRDSIRHIHQSVASIIGAPHDTEAARKCIIFSKELRATTNKLLLRQWGSMSSQWHWLFSTQMIRGRRSINEECLKLLLTYYFRYQQSLPPLLPMEESSSSMRIDIACLGGMTCLYNEMPYRQYCIKNITRITIPMLCI